MANLAIVVLALGAIWFEPAVEREHTPALRIAAPSIQQEHGSLSISGAVCRRGFAQGPPGYVVLERLSADRNILSTDRARIRGMPGYRGGCGFYAFTNVDGTPLMRLRAGS